MVHARKKNFWPLQASKQDNLPQSSTQRRHQANEGKGVLKPERVRAFGASQSLLSKKKPAAEKRLETAFLSNDENEKWIDD